MKVSIARIRLYLKEGKTLADGTHPIMLVCNFNGRKEVSTSYSCTSRYWDKRGECVKKGYPNYVMINHAISKMKEEAVARRNTYERLGEVYTPQMILSPRKVLDAVTNDLNGLIGRYIAEKGLEKRTVEKWWIVYRSVIKYNGREVIVNEIDESFCKGYCRWLEGNGLSHGSIRSYMSKVVAILHYAHHLKIISEYPLVGWKYHKDFRDSKSELYVHSRSMDILMGMLLDELIVRDGNLWHYRDGKVEELMDIHGELYGLYLYCIGYYMKGLAPVDISMLKRKDIRVVEIRGRSYYAIDGRRSKTCMLYKIRLEKDCLLSNVLIRTMLMFNDKGDYFLPTLCGYVGENIGKRVNNVYSYHSVNLVEWFKRCNERIVRINVEDGDSIPLIDLECRYYSYRHSYIQKEVQKPNVNLVKIATETGKSVSTLHQYISLLNEIDLV